jgi:glycogen debranching enzyme
MRVAPLYERFGLQFTWDLPYSARAVATVGRRPDLARGFVENMLDLQVSDGPDLGMVPRHMTRDGHMAGQDGSQVPMLAWLSMEIDAVEPDDDFLARVYPRLAGHVEWWQSPRRDFDGDGLCEYAGSTTTYVAYESGHDYSPERDLVMGEPTPPSSDGLVHEPIADVFLNSCVYAELDAMPRIAERLAVPDWGERRDALARRIHEAMWDAEIGGFFPVLRRDLCAAQPRVFRHTPAMLMPLWAGIATQEQGRETIDTLLGRRRNYPQWDGFMSVRLGGDFYNGYQVVTDALHPSRGSGAAAGGVDLDERGMVLRFGADRGPAHAPFLRLEGSVQVVHAGPEATLRLVTTDRDGVEHSLVAPDSVTPGMHSGTAGHEPMSHLPSEGLHWIRGIRELRLVARGCEVSEVTLRWNRVQHEGLLSPFGVKSNHPLDGKHPAPGAPTEFWSGTIWGPHQLHTCHALLRYGEVELASACARAFCDAVATAYAAGGDAFEHISHEDGRGLGTGRYTWTAGVALMLMEELVDRDVE